MFETAEIAVGAVKVDADFRPHPTTAFECAQGIERRADAEVGLPATGDQLLCLREKFDLANATTAEFQVLARDCDRPDLVVGMDLPLHRVNVGDRREVE